jgi:hypothetical protein
VSSAPKARFAVAGRLAGPALVAGAAGFFLAASWRRWTDPLVDFGRELYLPWRLSHGALLYRDAGDFYGPLSQYVNAELFRLFGPGLMVLAWANIALMGAVLCLIYALFARAWGRASATAACVAFLALFGCSVGVWGNFNFVTPYAHEATHGFLVCLLLVAALARWLRAPSAARAAAAGFLLGLTAVLKPEIMLGAAAATLAAAWSGRRSAGNRPALQALAWAGAAALPTLAFWAYFAASVPAGQALRFACSAWLNVVGPGNVVDPVLQRSFTGLDHPWDQLKAHLAATLWAALALAALGLGARAVDRARRPWVGAVLGVALTGAALGVSLSAIEWSLAGRCLFGLALLYLAGTCVDLRRQGGTQADRDRIGLRCLLAVLALALMARMILNGRINQFGFYQAALAALLIVAVLIGELPGRWHLGRRGRAVFLVAALALVGTGVVRLAARSQAMLRQRTYPVGQGADRFLALPPGVEATGALVEHLSAELRLRAPGQTLLVLPEGEMINYLARMPDTVAPFFFYSASTRGGREQGIVDALSRTPPDWIVIVSRDLREYGIERYGSAPGQGKLILDWAQQHYRLAGSLGGDPLDDRQRGAVLLRRN